MYKNNVRIIFNTVRSSDVYGIITVCNRENAEDSSLDDSQKDTMAQQQKC